MSHPGVNDDGDDEQFIQYLEKLQEQDMDQSTDGDRQDDREIEDEIEEDEEDEPFLNPYLPTEINPGMASASTVGSSALALAPSFDRSALSPMGNSIWVVYTNGIHQISMTNCECRGHDILPCNLLAACLLPASFRKIQTLFTGQLLDLFCLSNLKLKASAYQFYHLLQCLTSPMAPAEVVNLYREFHRMSWLWRWMKRLKWAGYGNSNRNASDVSPGELSVFCLACPQQGINLSENWKEDPERQVVTY